MTLQNKVFNELSLSVNDIFLKFQDELDIMSGDIDPLTHWELIKRMESLSDLIFEILESQQE